MVHSHMPDADGRCPEASERKHLKPALKRLPSLRESDQRNVEKWWQFSGRKNVPKNHTVIQRFYDKCLYGKFGSKSSEEANARTVV